MIVFWKVCRQCGSFELRPSLKAKTTVERLLSFALTPYRCYTCSCRQLKYNRVNIPATLPPLFLRPDVPGPAGGESALSPPRRPTFRQRLQVAFRRDSIWSASLRESLLCGVMVLCSVELALQMAAAATWWKYRPALDGQSAAQWNGQRVVLCVGDSYTLGFGAVQGSYPSRLEDLLRQEERSWRVVNAGWPVQNSRDAALRLEGQLAKYHPSLVYIMIGSDDGWSHPARLEPELAAGEDMDFQWRLRSLRLAELLASEGMGIAAKAGDRMGSVWRSVRYGRPDASTAFLAGTWSFQNQLIQIRPDHLLQIGGREFEWISHGHRMEIIARDRPTDFRAYYEWEQRKDRLFFKGGPFPAGAFLQRVNDAQPGMSTPSFHAQEPGPRSSAEATLATHLRRMIEDVRSARSEVVVLSYPGRGWGNLNGVLRQVAAETGAGWIDVDAAFSRSTVTAPTRDLYAPGRKLSADGCAFLAALVARDVRHRTQR